MTIPQALLLAVTAGTIAQAAAVTAGSYTIFEGTHSNLLNRLDQQGSPAARKAADLLSCPYCQTFWYALTATLIQPLDNINVVVQAGGTWAAAALWLTAQWGRS